jgi:hypothetical protein
LSAEPDNVEVPHGWQRQLKAVLSADVKGYRKLMGDDDEPTVTTITAYRESSPN